MIRPRVGDFVYSTHEFETMLEDINVFRTLGVHGVVIGVLLPDGSVDRERCKKYVPWTRCRRTAHARADRPTRLVAEAIPMQGVLRSNTISCQQPQLNREQPLFGFQSPFTGRSI
jgi:hypothetical protein